MKELIDELKQNIDGEVRADNLTKKLYAVDASLFEIEPLGVVIPRTQEALQKAVKITTKYNIPVIPRGAATGVTGGCIGKGIVIDTAKYLNRILEINLEEGYAVCEPGVIQDTLNEKLQEHGYRLGPDTSTGNRATIGGMLANNAAGSYSLRYGKMVDHIEEVDLILADGDRIRLGNVSDGEIIEKGIFQTIQTVIENNRDEILEKFPSIPRRVSGYNLDEFVNGSPVNFAKLIAGSEGSLGITAQMKVKIVPAPKNIGLAVIHFHSLTEALDQVQTLLLQSPLALELIDDKIIKMGRLSPVLQDKLSWLQGNPEALLVVGFDGESPNETISKIEKIQSRYGYATEIITDTPTMKSVWELRKAGLELLLSKRSYSRAVAFIEDIALDPKNLSQFIREFLSILNQVDTHAGLYGHVGAGCIHIRPFLNMQKEKDRETLKDIMEKVKNLILTHHGSMSGEHGDGFIRSWTNRELFGEKLYLAFQTIKHAFDPHNLMNPEKVVTQITQENFLENLRKTPKKEISTFLDFSEEGGFSLSVDMCNGNGLCRKQSSLMCPSFQATNDEYDTTRARANALRAVVNGDSEIKDLSDPRLTEILDLCLSCKGCKKECPSHVDMAKMKAEVLYQHYEKQRRPLRDYLFGYISQLNSLSSRFPRFYNWITGTFLFKVITSLVGISPKRVLPKLATKRFSTIEKKQVQSRKKVVLFNDTFNEFHSPEIGTDALEILQHLGFDVLIPPYTCCGRTLLSKGFLPQAKEKIEKVVALLKPYAEEGIPIVGIEPSCILTLRDESLAMIPTETAKKVASMCFTFDEFLHQNKNLLQLAESNCEILLHGHCHQKALVGTKETLAVLKKIPGAHVREIPSGCCGMAGSFGYEKEHYDISMKIANLQLIPAIEKKDPKTLIIANGFSCRSQISGEGQHLAQILRKFLL